MANAERIEHFLPLTQEQSSRLDLFRKVSRYYGLNLDEKQLLDFTARLSVIQQTLASHGYTYGLPPHRMRSETKTEFEQIGFTLLNISPKDRVNLDNWMEIGMDFAKSAIVDLTSQDGEEWIEYLDKKIESIRD